MSVVNISNLLVQLNQKINSTSDDKEILILVKALEKLKTGIVFTVPTFANLPDASENIGKLYFVENDGILYFSVVSNYNNLEYWVPVTNGLQISPLLTWGRGGVLGDGTTVSRRSPGTVAGDIANWCRVSGGSAHSAAIKTDGTLWTWGFNGQGRLGDGTTVSRNSPGTVAGGGTNWCLVSGGYCSASAIKTDGTLWTWGSNFCGQLGDGTTLDRSSPGTVAGGGTNWCQVSGYNNSVAIKTDGTIWTWGCNRCGGLGDGTTLNRSSPGTIWGNDTTWCRVSGGQFNVAAIKTDGTLWTWGYNNRGQLGNGTVTNGCSPGTIAGGGTNWCQVSTRSLFMLGIKCDGTLWTWGFNCSGQLGDGTTVSKSSPGTVAGSGTTWCQVSGGTFHNIAIKTDGTLWTWGRNCYGALGDGTTISRCSPGTTAGGGTTWCWVSTNLNSTAAIQRETL